MFTSFVPWLDGIPRGAGLAKAQAPLDDHEIDKNRAGWTSTIEGPLVEISSRGASLVEDGLIPPSARALQTARQVAEKGREHGWPPPHRVVASGDGGILFERRDGEEFETLEVLDDGTVELAYFRNSQLYGRRRLP